MRAIKGPARFLVQLFGLRFQLFWRNFAARILSLWGGIFRYFPGFLSWLPDFPAFASLAWDVNLGGGDTFR